MQVTLFLREPVIILHHQNELVAILKNDKEHQQPESITVLRVAIYLTVDRKQE